MTPLFTFLFLDRQKARGGDVKGGRRKMTTKGIQRLIRLIEPFPLSQRRATPADAFALAVEETRKAHNPVEVFSTPNFDQEQLESVPHPLRSSPLNSHRHFRPRLSSQATSSLMYRLVWSTWHLPQWHNGEIDDLFDLSNMTDFKSAVSLCTLLLLVTLAH